MRHIYFVLFVLLGATAITKAHDNSTSLDPSIKLLALQLFKDTSNNGLFSKVLSAFPGASQVQNLSTDQLGKLYIQYTYAQIDALQTELSREDTRIFQAMKVKTQLIKSSWDKTVIEYRDNLDIKEFEENFMQTGNNLVSLQKLVIRVINSAIVEVNENITQRQGKSNQGFQYQQNSWQLFERFLIGGNKLGLARSSDDSSLDNSTDNSISATVNQLGLLMNELQQSGGLSDEETREKLNDIRRLVKRIRQIQQLNKIGLTPNMYLNTENVSPYSFEAVLRLVNLLGAGNTGVPNRAGGGNTNQPMKQMIGLFRTWVNLFQGGSIFQLITSPTFTTTYNRQYDPKKVNRMKQLLKQMQTRQMNEIENKRMANDMKQMLANQNKQQQQINQILDMIKGNAGKGTGDKNKKPTQPPSTWDITTLSTINTPSFTLYPPGIGDMLDDNNNRNTASTPTSISSASTPGWNKKPSTNFPQWPGSSLNPNDILNQIKNQRKHLNNLLAELQQPFEVSTSSSVNTASSSFSPPSQDGGSSQTKRPTNTDVAQAQQTMMNIMKSILPMINMVGQSGMVSKPRIDSSKVELLSIINSVNGRELDIDEDPAKEIKRVVRLGQKLSSVVESIILEAENSTF